MDQADGATAPAVFQMEFQALLVILTKRIFETDLLGARLLVFPISNFRKVFLRNFGYLLMVLVD